MLGTTPSRQVINEYGALRPVSHSLLPLPLPISLVVGFGRVRHLQQRSQWYGLDKQRIKREHRLMSLAGALSNPLSVSYSPARFSKMSFIPPWTLDKLSVCVLISVCASSAPMMALRVEFHPEFTPQGSTLDGNQQVGH